MRFFKNIVLHTDDCISSQDNCVGEWLCFGLFYREPCTIRQRGFWKVSLFWDIGRRDSGDWNTDCCQKVSSSWWTAGQYQSHGFSKALYRWIDGKISNDIGITQSNVQKGWDKIFQPFWAKNQQMIYLDCGSMYRDCVPTYLLGPANSRLNRDNALALATIREERSPDSPIIESSSLESRSKRPVFRRWTSRSTPMGSSGDRSIHSTNWLWRWRNRLCRIALAAGSQPPDERRFMKRFFYIPNGDSKVHYE